MKLDISEQQVEQLDTINQIVESAVYSWPLPARLKRLALPALQYKSIDYRDFEIFSCYKASANVGVAVWQPSNPLAHAETCDVALLHGLYVHSGAQREGIGSMLINHIANRAESIGMAGLYVRAERVSVDYFARQGFRMLAADEDPGAGITPYPYRMLRLFAV